ncbi:unnamed protein product [Microthlaspi erraticum]|uniref:Serpin domain-containing protein n=1 Tax=Microthlaspi erraticum TaxID=1685480 RepID=A0A6D2IEW2_9BRAS|nr:unnamed protein product [Microthlaspi erraticum]
MGVQKAMKNQTQVAVILSKQLFSTVAKRSNSVFSPASITAAFTMVASGPDGKGETLKAILSFLRSSSVEELNAVYNLISSSVFADGSSFGGPTIKVANGVWVEQTIPINPSVKPLFENFFKAVFASVDFKSKAEELRLEVNAWAKQHTDGLIKDLLPPRSVHSFTKSVYGNALYFKGAWEERFDKAMTMNRDFHLFNGASISVPFMSSYYKRQYVAAYDGFKVLKLPFRQGGDVNRSFSMYFYLPDGRFGLDRLVERMASTPRFLDGYVPRERVAVGEFRIPKFKIEFGFETSKEFNLGFDVVDLYHKACVEVDEEGAEAAAATAVVTSVGCAFVKIDYVSFVADHPFLFLIREERSGAVLFVGQMCDPSSSVST